MVEQELRSDYIRSLEERGEEVPSAVPSSINKMNTDIIDKEFKEKRREAEERIAAQHRNLEEGTAQLLDEFAEGDRKLREKEIELDQVMQAEYKQREAGNAGSVIPAAIRKENHEAGAVSATDSESETEFQQKLRGNRTKKAFKWTPKHEHELEELLIKHSFDFKAATRDFLRLINSLDDEQYYEMDTKTLQLRWTDIEIRKYRLNNAAASNMKFNQEEEDDDLELRDLDEETDDDKSAVGPSQEPTQSKADHAESPSIEQRQADRQAKLHEKEELLRREQEYQKETKDRVQTNMFGYSDGSSSEDNQIDSSTASTLKNKDKHSHASSVTPYYSDLEELD